MSAENEQIPSMAGSPARDARVRAVLEDCRCRRVGGEVVSDDALIAAHPDLMPELAEELRKLRIIAAAREQAAQPIVAETATHFHQNSDTGAGSGRLEVRCPGCHAPMDVAVDTALTDLTCSSCGSHFSLVDQSKATRMAPSLTKLGRFELIERLGVGGFGSVWKARDKELDRTVAIKIPRAGGMTAEEQEKFFREARAAAQLSHPSIVSVHEVGRDGDNIYIVSDFVRGVTLGDWLTGQQLTNREAAELCAKIADALHHAHEQGVVHRDLKPANIMMDYDGQPHLMDFGLARRETGEVTMTMDGQVLGTPAYMSPEQAQGEAHSADRRSDVYSLGVILFQLLTGELPFRGNARMLIKQVIQDEPPSPRKLNGNVPRDLETITLKCLEKSPERRYSDAKELVAELRRHLAGEPIHARSITRFERTARWVRRNKIVSGLAASVAVTLLSGAIVSTYFAIHAHLQAQIAHERERDALISEQKADAARTQEAQARKSAEAVTTFLVNAFRSPDPDRDGRTVTVAEVLDRAEKQLREDLFDQPLTRAALLDAIGSSRQALGLLQDFLGPLTEAKQLYERELGLDHPVTIAAVDNLANGYLELGQEDEAIALYEQAVTARRNGTGANDPNTQAIVEKLASAYERSGRNDEAIQIHERILSERRNTFGEFDSRTLVSLCDVAASYVNAGRYEKAINLLESLSKTHSAFGDNNSTTRRALAILAIAHYRIGRANHANKILERVLAGSYGKIGSDELMSIAGTYDSVGQVHQAIPLYEKVVVQRQNKFGIEHALTLDAMSSLAFAYRKVHRIDDTVRVLEQVLAIRRDKIGDDNPDTMSSMINLLEAYDQVGRHKDADQLLQQVRAIRVELIAESRFHSEFGQNYDRLIGILNARDDSEGAIALSRRVISSWTKLVADRPAQPYWRNRLADIHSRFGSLLAGLNDRTGANEQYQLAIDIRKKLVSDFPNMPEYRTRLAGCYADVGSAFSEVGRLGEVEKLEEVIASQKTTLGPDHRDTLASMSSLAAAYEHAGRRDDAIKLRQQVVADYERTLKADHPDSFNAKVELANAYVAANRSDDAIRVREEIIASQKTTLGPDHPDTLSSMNNLGSAYLTARRLDEAAKVNQQLLQLGSFLRGLSLSVKIGPDGVDHLIDAAVAHRGEETSQPLDALVLGELRLLAGNPQSAESPIRAAIKLDGSKPYFYKSLGWCLLAQGKTDEARNAFQEVIKDRKSKDGTYDLKKADPDQMTAAYFLDLVTEQAYAKHFESDKKLACFPWFYIAQRREIEGKKEAAIEAYEKCVALGKGDNPHPVRALAEWRLVQLRKASQRSRE